MTLRPLFILFFCALISSLAAGEPAAGNSAGGDCVAREGVTPLCGFQAPEDIELSPDRRSLIVSEFGGLIDPIPGRLVRLDLATETTELLYPRPGAVGEPTWGDPACPGAPGAAFAPHGIHLSRRADGAWQLLAVNHYSRESQPWLLPHGLPDSGHRSWQPAGAAAV